MTGGKSVSRNVKTRVLLEVRCELCNDAIKVKLGELATINLRYFGQRYREERHLAIVTSKLQIGPSTYGLDGRILVDDDICSSCNY